MNAPKEHDIVIVISDLRSGGTQRVVKNLANEYSDANILG